MDSSASALKFRKLSPEAKYARVVPGLLKRVRDLYEEIYRRFGDQGLDLIRDVSREYGRAAASKSLLRHQVSGVADVGRYLLMVFDMVTPHWEVSHFDDDKLIIKVTECPYPFTNPDVCEAHTTMERALVETFDPSLEYRIGCSVARGDNYCEHILTRRKAAG